MVEPTLRDEAGHCYSYAQSLLGEAKKQSLGVELWAGKGGESLFKGERVHGFFSQRYRKLQQIYLFYKLIGQDANIFVPITSSFELKVLVHLLRISKKYRGKIFLHFHQYKRKSKKLHFLSELAKKHPEFYIMASTDRLAEIFISAGFKNVQAVAYPVYGKELGYKHDTQKVPNLVYVGAAREDKGFVQVVDFIEFMVEKKIDFKFIIQCSKPHGGKYDKVVLEAVEKLKALQSKTKNIEILEYTLTSGQYWGLFKDAICFAVYDKSKYADSVSGVLLDAMSAHVPIVTTLDTWMADIILEHRAGEVVNSRDESNLMKAVQAILSDYGTYVKHAGRASESLRQFHSPEPTIKYIKHSLEDGL